jgi:Flp pilus assembly CpaF family ATPase
MRIWYNNILEAETRQLYEAKSPRVRIGRAPDSDIVLTSPFVPLEAVLLFQRPEGWEVVALGIDGVAVDENELYSGQRLLVKSDATVRIWPYTFSLEVAGAGQASERHRLEQLERQLSDMIRSIHLQLLKRMDLNALDETRAGNDEYLRNLERHIDDLSRQEKLLTPEAAPLLGHIAGQSVRRSIIDVLIDRSAVVRPTAWSGDRTWTRLVTAVPDREDEMRRAIDYVSADLKLPSIPELGRQLSSIETRFGDAWGKLCRQLDPGFLQYMAQRFLKKEVKDIVFGYGPLEDLLRTPTISEIMIVDRDHIYVERDGVLENSGRRFISDDVTLTIIERIVARVGRRIDKSKPLVDARLTDGSRVNAVIPPIAVSGPCLTIRKFPTRKLLVDDLVAKGSLSRAAAEFLRAAVLARCNILIAGGTGTGKTTLLNCLSDFIPDKERIVTIEDTAELQLKKEHVVRLETKQENIEGAGAFSIRDLVKNALRMRPDRIVVGECRGAEALDMLQAMNTGHDGSMTTVHANEAADVILRLEVLVQMAADLPISSIHRQIASAIDLIVQLTRLKDGRRCVTQITEVVDVDVHHSTVRLKDLFLLSETETRPELCPTGRLPTFMDELISNKLIDLDAFYL